jgi:hypothetical protein
MEDCKITMIKTTSLIFQREIFGGNENGLNRTTINREILHMGFTRKVLERRHILQDSIARYNYLETISFLHLKYIVDIDATASSANQFYEKYGYAMKGHKAIKTQITINNKHYSAIAAYTIHGFLAWRVVEGSYTNEDFIEFLNNELAVF